MQQLVKKESYEAVETINVKEKANTCVIYYVVKWMKKFLLTVSSFASTSLSQFLSSVCIFVF